MTLLSFLNKDQIKLISSDSISPCRSVEQPCFIAFTFNVLLRKGRVSKDSVLVLGGEKQPEWSGNQSACKVFMQETKRYASFMAFHNQILNRLILLAQLITVTDPLYVGGRMNMPINVRCLF